MPIRCHPSREGKNTKTRTRDNRWYGYIPDLPDHRDLELKYSSIRIPSTIDLRQSPNNPGIWNQGALGSCVEHGISRGYVYALRKQDHTDYMPSRLFGYYEGRVIEGTVNEDSGLMIRDGMEVLRKMGAPHENLWPYDISKFKQKPPAAAYTDGLLHQCIEYRRVSVSPYAVDYALAKDLPVIFGFAVPASFESDEVANTGIVPKPGADEWIVGGHCMTYVGRETLPISRKKYRIAANSWDLDWGDHGYCYMPEEYCSPTWADDFWVVQLVE